MGLSLSKESQELLEAAQAGDVAWLQRQIACEPKLISSVTLVKRRSVLHLAAKQGHAEVLSAVLGPLIDAVREEYYAFQEEQRRLSKGRGEPEGQDADGEQQQQEEDQQQQLRDEHGDNLRDEPRPRPQPRPQPQPQQGDDPQQQQLSLFRRSSFGPRSQQRPERQGQAQQQQAEPNLPTFKRLRSTVNARDLYRRTPLIVAAKQGHLDCTQMLVEAASNLFAMDREGNTSLHYAALHGHSAVCDYLLQKATDRNLARRYVNKRNLSGFTALHYAVWGCHEGAVQQLLAAGADASAANDRVFDAWVTVPVGSTPLHLAVMRNSTAVALQLLQHYVLEQVTRPSDSPRAPDLRTATNIYGMNPAQLAAHRGLRQLSRVLLPSLPLSRVLEAFEPGAHRSYGPPSLRSIAAGAMAVRLHAELDLLEQQQRAEAADAALKQAAAAAHQLQVLHRCRSDGACCDVCCCSSACAAASGDKQERQEALAACALSPASSSASSTLAELLPPAKEEAPAEQLLRPDSPLAAAQAAAAAAAAKPGDGKDPCTAAACSPGSLFDEQCCVCWEEQVSVAVGPCRHALCLACARQLVANSERRGATCPLCRAIMASFSPLPAPGAAGLRLLLGAGI